MAHGGSGAHVQIAIVGSGFGGLGMAIRLKREGIDDFVVLERAGDVGGTWRDNTYPGCACDVPSHLYSFSFAPNPDWRRTFSPPAGDLGLPPALRRRLRRAAAPALRPRGARRGVGRGRAALAHRDHRRAVRRPTCSSRRGRAQRAGVPELPGLEPFAGAAFHSARWDHDARPHRRRVAVIGTGASAIQFVPEIQPHVARPARLPAHAAVGHAPPRPRARRLRAARFPPRPGAAAARRGRHLRWRARRCCSTSATRGSTRLAERVALRHLRARGAATRRCAPGSPRATRIGCKRVLLSDDYLPALTRSNVEVVTDGRSPRCGRIRRHRRRRRAPGGRDHLRHRLPRHRPAARAERIRGRDGRTLAEAWAGQPAGAPRHDRRRLPEPVPAARPEHRARPHLGGDHDRGAARARPRRAAPPARARRRRARAAPGGAGGVHRRGRRADGGHGVDRGRLPSWYLDATGRNSTLWPGITWRFRRRRRASPADYVAARAHPVPPPEVLAA